MKNKARKEKFQTTLKKIIKGRRDLVNTSVRSVTSGGSRIQWNTPLTVSKLTLLKKEIGKWQERDPGGFEEWSERFQIDCDALKRPYLNEDKKKQIYEDMLDKEKTLVNEIMTNGFTFDEKYNKFKKTLNGRAKKISKKFANNTIWPTGTLLWIKDPIVHDKMINRPPTGKGWFVPVADHEVWEEILYVYGRGDKFPNNYSPLLEKYIKLNDKLDKDRKFLAMVTGEYIIRGSTYAMEYSWVRLVKLLSENDEWVMILRPNLERNDIKKLASVAQWKRNDKNTPIKDDLSRSEIITIQKDDLLKNSWFNESPLLMA